MIAYNVTGLDHAVIRDQAQAAYDRGNISAGEFTGIMDAFPEILYSPNFFIRIGLFLLTTVIAICALGLMALITIGGLTESFFGVLLLFSGGCMYALLEMWWIKDKDHYRSGIDDALTWISAVSALTGFMLLVNLDPGTSFGCAAACGIATWMTIRFADMIMGLVAFSAGIAWIFFAGFEISPVVADFMPFIIMAASFGAYRWFEQMRRKKKLRHYENSLIVLSTAALITLYMAGNYFVVREMGASLLGKTGTVPIGWLFWILTFVIPAVYIYLGIRRKHRILLRSGLVLLGMIVFTVRYYHSLMPIESAMVLGGVVLVVVAWGVIRYLKQPRNGFTYEADETAEEMTGLKAAEAIIIAQTFHKTPQPDDSFKFGGGTGGGGGASGEY
ncbi:hypothetical protein ACFOTA_18275 [Chitinophaga sp. GCM10012297]|uniref:DUF2157 domain-containing protein n=1 Tax=Chitinophaga chungangae TaxID=2821488 RepID=A0ABS3YHI9_9BACT|nr:hypothetical protein [Chitinophaga chungangae]MBO9154168.1 hypothetical protein [Chitinophaga chungangae]